MNHFWQSIFKKSVFSYFENMILAFIHESYFKNRLFTNLVSPNLETLLLVLMHDSHSENRFFSYSVLTHFEQNYGTYEWIVIDSFRNLFLANCETKLLLFMPGSCFDNIFSDTCFWNISKTTHQYLCTMLWKLIFSEIRCCQFVTNLY